MNTWKMKIKKTKSKMNVTDSGVSAAIVVFPPGCVINVFPVIVGWLVVGSGLVIYGSVSCWFWFSYMWVS